MEAPAASLNADGATEPWWRGAVVYQIYPRSFADTNGDGVGDLPGIIERLPYVASLGVDAVWLSPFYRSPQRDFGYDVADYCDVDPLFGGLADFDRLVERAHGLGLRVLVDLVCSHTSDQHAWFQESRRSRTGPKADWYVWADPKPDGSPPNNWQSVFHGPCWTWDARRGQYYLHNFLSGQPDLNGHNSEVQDALLAAAEFWLERGVDGFRLDALNFLMCDPSLRDNPPTPADGRPRTRPFDYQDHVHNQSHGDIPVFIERFRRLLDRYPERFAVAEVGGQRAPEEMKAYTAGSTRLNSAYGFQFLYASQLTAAHVRSTAAAWASDDQGGWPSWAFSNHDAPRAVSRWSGGRRQDAWAKLTSALLLTLRGNGIIWQGEELGLPQADVPFERLRDPEAVANWPETLGRDGARTPMPWSADAPHAGFSPVDPWLPVDPRHHALAVDRQVDDSGSTLAFVRRLVAFRKAQPVIRSGDFHAVDAPEPVLAFERRLGGQRRLCIFNLGENAVAWTPPGRWRVIFGTGVAAGVLPVQLDSLSGWIAEPD